MKLFCADSTATETAVQTKTPKPLPKPLPQPIPLPKPGFKPGELQPKPFGTSTNIEISMCKNNIDRNVMAQSEFKQRRKEVKEL